MEHWLPLFHERLEPLFDYAPGAPVSFDHLAEDAVGERLALIEDHYEARVEALEALKFGAPPYNPVPPAAAVLHAADWAEALGRAPGAPAVAVRTCRAAGRRRRALVAAGAGAQLCRRARRPKASMCSTQCGMPRRGPAGAGQARDRRRLGRRRARAAGHALRRQPARQCAQSGELRRGRGAAARRDRPGRAADRARLRGAGTSPSSASRTFSATGWCGQAASAQRRTTS